MVLGVSVLTGLAASAILLGALIILHSLTADAWLLTLVLLAYPGIIASRAFYREFHIHWKRLVAVKAR
jgi:hypothetical protein